MFVFYFRFLNNKYKAKIKYKHFSFLTKPFYYIFFSILCVTPFPQMRKSVSMLKSLWKYRGNIVPFCGNA